MDTPQRRRGHDPWAALRQANFRLFVLNRLLIAAALSLLQAAIAWQVYQITGSALQLGLLGLVRLLPAIGLGLFAGAVADSYDRRRIAILAALGPLVCAVALLLLTRAGNARVALIDALVFVLAIGAAFEEPATDSLLPLLVAREHFANAVALSSALQEIAIVVAPAVGGLVIARWGIAPVYALTVVLVVPATAVLFALRPGRGETERSEVSLAAIVEGLRFLRHNQVLVGAMTLDLVAVIFAGATALLPIYAQRILHSGAAGFGLLSSSFAVGAILVSLLLAARRPVQRTGRALLLAQVVFALTTIAFGVSRSFPLSLLLYACVGAADQVSVVMRHTMIQLATPDRLRGRISSVSFLFIGTSNQIGLVESGLVAALSSATFAVVSGGAACLLIVAILAARLPELRRYSTRHEGS